jgi:high-affinity nickel-transport protein
VIGDARAEFFYLLVFGAGTVAGMMLLRTVVALPFAYTAGRLERWNAWLARVTGVASVAFGIAVTYRLIALQGFLTQNPQWTPQ